MSNFLDSEKGSLWYFHITEQGVDCRPPWRSCVAYKSLSSSQHDYIKNKTMIMKLEPGAEVIEYHSYCKVLFLDEAGILRTGWMTTSPWIKSCEGLIGE